jgi:hypothetical protein
MREGDQPFRGWARPVTIEAAMRDRIIRQIGKALVEIGWDRPLLAVEVLEQAVSHLRELAARDIKGSE